MPHLFRKFSRVEPDGQEEDTGLGLAIRKGIIEAHGGASGPRATAQAREARFTFTVPAVEEAATERHWPAPSE